jgi:DNA-binding CsgD family transcriptional regulator
MGRASGRFVGRDAELSRLGEHVSSARGGESVAVLVEADAGMGKSRLVAEAVAACREPKDAIAIGHGVDLTGGELPYGVAAETLRTLARDVGSDVVRLAANGLAEDLAPLVPQFGATERTADPLRLFPAYLTALETLAADRLVWLIIEDLHWVDASSRDLLTYLLRVVQPCQLLTVLTLRTHDPAVDPAAAALAANLAAQPGVDRIALAPLEQSAVSTLVTDLANGPTRQQIALVVSLAQGSPLFAEQLVAAGMQEGDRIPEQVMQPMAARLRALDSDTRHLVQVASLAEGQLEHRLLIQAHAATAPAGADVERAAARALEQHILRVEPQRSYSFAHALLRQAAEESMTPSERMRAHRAWATVLSERGNHGGDRLLQIAAAHHWVETDDDQEAFGAALRAAAHANWLGAPREEVAMLRRSLTLWDRVPDPERRSDKSREALLLDTIQACHKASRTADALELLDAEVNRVTGTDTLRELCLRLKREDLRAIMGADVSTRVFVEAHAHLDELLAAEPTPLVCSALQVLGWHLRYTDSEESFRLHAYAARATAQVDRTRRGAAPISYIDQLGQRGRFDEALALLDEARSESSDSATLMTIDCDIGENYYRAGRFQDAMAVHESSLVRLHDPHVMPRWWAYVSLLLAMAQHAAGEWIRADAVLSLALSLDYDDVETKAMVAAKAGQFACLAGDLERAQTLTTTARSLLPAYYDTFLFPCLVDTVQLEAELAAGLGDLGAARGYLDRLVKAPGLEAGGDLWEAVLLAAGVESDLSEDSRAATEQRSAIRAAAERLPGAGAYWGASRLQVHADLAHAEGADTAGTWSEVVDTWRALEHRPRLGWALLRLADAQRNTGDRASAAAVLGEALAIANRLGAAPLRDAAVDLARRGHLKLETGVPSTTRPVGPLARLTARELEVLRHVALGESNDELAISLFISPKTASVHVSRILTKLGVSSRAKATALAYEHGLMSGGPLP